MFKYRILWSVCSLFIVALAAAYPVSAEQLTVIGYNVESGGSDPETIARQIAQIGDCDLWGFSEVLDSSWAPIFEAGAERGQRADFRSIMGTTGRDDHLLILYNSSRLEALRHFELAAINIGGYVRAPLVGEFRLKPTGQRFLFMVNHLYRTNDERRHEQARLLNQWAAQQTLPIIAVGDYNFDWNVSDGNKDHDDGYDLLTVNDVFSWIPPRKLVPTKCGTPTVLDFTFVSGPARDWSGVSDILFAGATYCPDDSTTSDHRPVRTTFQLVDGASTPAPTPPVTLEMLLHRIERLERQVGLPPPSE